MGLFSDLKGTSSISFVLNLLGVRLKDNNGNLAIRNNADNADAEITASKVNVSGDEVVLNSDASESGSDYKISLKRPTTGMSNSYSLTLPTAPGAPGQVLADLDGNGNLVFVSAASTTDCIHVESTTINFGDSSPVTALTIPTGTQVLKTEVILDTPFNGTSPNLSVGISGSTSKYMPTTANNLKGSAKDSYEYYSNETPVGSPETIIISFAPDSSTEGSARVDIYYTIPA